MDDLRLDVLKKLRSPDSAVGLSRRLDIPRQRINYHLKALEKAGLLRLVEERRQRNCIERIMQATAHSYAISPSVLGSLGATAERSQDHFSWAYLVSLAARALQELGVLRRRADEEKKKVATFSLETEVEFGSPKDLEAFMLDLTDQLNRLVAKYQVTSDEATRRFRILLGAYPKPSNNTERGEL